MIVFDDLKFKTNLLIFIYQEVNYRVKNSFISLFYSYGDDKEKNEAFIASPLNGPFHNAQFEIIEYFYLKSNIEIRCYSY